MLGSIAGDIIGSVYEGRPIKRKDFPLFSPASIFTDDSVLTVAVAQAILSNRPYGDAIRETACRYPDAGYGGMFALWIFSNCPEPYGSWGNGAAMRVGPVGFAFTDEETVLEEARKCADVTHNHPEGIKGAQATALAVFLAKQGAGKEIIRERIQQQFGYDLNRTVDSIRPTYRFDVSCQGTVPEAIISFLDSHTFEDAIRNAVSLGGDSDTLACIAGGIAEAFYREIPREILREIEARLAPELWRTAMRFHRRYGMGTVEK